jgi:biopolymer transport protein ExbD
LLRETIQFFITRHWEEAVKAGQIFQTNFSYSNGIGEVIRKKQQWLDINRGNDEARNGLMLLIKADDNTSYENLLKVMDEIAINQVKKYAILKLTQEENDYLKK